MSHTERKYSRSDKIEPKNIATIVHRARSLVNDAREPNPTIRTMALVVIDDFESITKLNPRLRFKEAITTARLASSTPEISCETSEHKCGGAMAVKALELSAAIGMKTNSYSKAVIQMKRIIAQREKRRNLNEGAQKRSASEYSSRGSRRQQKRHSAPRGMAA